MSATVVATVAEFGSGTRSTLPPLADYINTAALNGLFAATTADGPVACVTFAYAGYTVVVQSTGRVLVRRD